MKMYAAFLRGVSPMNAKMPEIKLAFEKGGYTDVRTILGTGNVVFGADATPIPKLERDTEAVMRKHLKTGFVTFVRPLATIRALIDASPFDDFKFPKEAKRVVTFLRKKPDKLPRFPIGESGAELLGVKDGMLFSAYVRSEEGPVFMRLIEKTFGKDVTTRTWDTVNKVCK